MIACCSPILSVRWTALVTCRAFWNSGSEIYHDLCLGLDFPSRRDNFPIGSPLPPRGSVESVGMCSTIPFGIGKSGPSSPNLVYPTNGRIWPGLTSMGLLSGGAIIHLVGSSGAACLHLCRFLEILLSNCSTLAESELDPHSHQLHVSGEALCFPSDLTSFWGYQVPIQAQIVLPPPYGGGPFLRRVSPQELWGSLSIPHIYLNVGHDFWPHSPRELLLSSETVFLPSASSSHNHCWVHICILPSIQV